VTQQFDFFTDDEEAEAPALGPRRRRSVKQVVTADSEGGLVRQLEATGRYRVLKRLEPRPIVPFPRPGFFRRGVLVDAETTGLNNREDEIIEIGIVAFSFDEQGAIGDVTGVYSALHEPTRPIPAEITRLTGITDEMVTGHMIDPQQLRSLVEPADLVIAHYARFDRPFFEAFSPLFDRKAWACSVSEIDWAARGFEGNKLGYLIGQAGYFHEAHRAVDDCFALLEILDRGHGDSASSPFSELYLSSQQNRARIYAEHSPFEMKDQLKMRGYRWSDGSDGGPKSWWIEIEEHRVQDEINYLRAEIYGWEEADPPVRYMTAFERFKS
jgi:DNA polymerase-3 subunit epsilon